MKSFILIIIMISNGSFCQAQILDSDVSDYVDSLMSDPVFSKQYSSQNSVNYNEQTLYDSIQLMLTQQYIEERKKTTTSLNWPFRSFKINGSDIFETMYTNKGFEYYLQDKYQINPPVYFLDAYGNFPLLCMIV